VTFAASSVSGPTPLVPPADWPFLCLFLIIAGTAGLWYYMGWSGEALFSSLGSLNSLCALPLRTEAPILTFPVFLFFVIVAFGWGFLVWVFRGFGYVWQMLRPRCGLP
jgi:hypothetical protein